MKIYTTAHQKMSEFLLCLNYNSISLPKKFMYVYIFICYECFTSIKFLPENVSLKNVILVYNVCLNLWPYNHPCHPNQPCHPVDNKDCYQSNCIPIPIPMIVYQGSTPHR